MEFSKCIPVTGGTPMSLLCRGVTMVQTVMIPIIGPAGELGDLMAWVACLADARPANAYAALLVEAGFVNVAVEHHDSVLLEMIRKIGSRLVAVNLLRGLQKIELGGFNFDAARQMTRQALVAVADRPCLQSRTHRHQCDADFITYDGTNDGANAQQPQFSNRL